MAVSQEEEKEFVTYLLELMRSIGPVQSRSMFGGHGIFLNKCMFGLVADSVLYLKADSQTIPAFEQRGLEAFHYVKNGKAYKMSYYQAPEDALEDEHTMQEWALQAYNVAEKASPKKPHARN